MKWEFFQPKLGSANSSFSSTIFDLYLYFAIRRANLCNFHFDHSKVRPSPNFRGRMQQPCCEKGCTTHTSGVGDQFSEFSDQKSLISHAIPRMMKWSKLAYDSCDEIWRFFVFQRFFEWFSRVSWENWVRMLKFKRFCECENTVSCYSWGKLKTNVKGIHAVWPWWRLSVFVASESRFILQFDATHFFTMGKTSQSKPSRRMQLAAND